MIRQIAKKIYKDEYIEISYICGGSMVILNWLPENRRMSELEFCKQLKVMVQIIEEYEPRFVYIDAFDFNYPIFQCAVKLINRILERATLQAIGFVNSQHLLGSVFIKRLVTKIQTDIRIVIFNGRKEGKRWIMNFSGINLSSKTAD